MCKLELFTKSYKELKADMSDHFLYLEESKGSIEISVWIDICASNNSNKVLRERSKSLVSNKCDFTQFRFL